MQLKQFLQQLATTEGNVSVHEGVVHFPDGTTFDLGKSDAFSPHYGPMIERFSLCHTGNNPESFTAEAGRTGDYEPDTGRSIYEEVRIGLFRGDSTDCVADILVGLTETGEPRVIVSADGNGDSHAFALYPMRKADVASERWGDN